MAAVAARAKVLSPPARLELRSRQRILAVAGITYLVWWFAVEALLPGSYNPLAGRLVVVAVFFLTLGMSFIVPLSAGVLDGALNAGVWLLTAHYFYLVHRNGGAMSWAVGAYIVVTAVGVCLRSRGTLLAYSVLSMALGIVVALLDPALDSIFLPGLATMLVLGNVTLHMRSLLERERAERVRADEQRLAAEANLVARDEFIAIASHELKTPLTALQLTIESLSNTLRKRASLTEAEAAERLERTRRHVTRLTRLIEELLSASRIGTEGLSLRIESVELTELVTEVVDGLAEDAARAETKIVVEARHKVVVPCDRLRLEQVVTHLVRNALAFGQGKTVRVSIGSDDEHVRVCVADRGIGIACADQSRIFERFERAVSSVNYGGMGLGLYIAKEILDAHGGTIRVESQPGEGATFIVELPLNEAPGK